MQINFILVNIKFSVQRNIKGNGFNILIKFQQGYYFASTRVSQQWHCVDILKGIIWGWGALSCAFQGV